MKKVQQSYVGVFSIALVLTATFAACGGLDPRKITRGDEEPSGKGGEGNDPKPGAGGSENSAGGGENNTPFGGDKGYEGGAPPVVDGPPTVVEVSPGTDADDAEPNDNVGLRFSEGLDAATVTPDIIKIMDGDVEVDGDLSYEGIDALFEPSRRLSLLATYDVSVSTDVTDSAGIALEEPFASKFTVRDGVWGKLGQAFEEQEQWGGQQDVAIAANGNALVVYTKRDPNAENVTKIYARWYRATGGWQAERSLESLTIGVGGYNIKAAVSPEGEAIAAWWTSEGGSYRLRASRYVNGDWEAEPQYVEQMAATLPNDNFSSEISLAIGSGRVAVAWVRSTYIKMSPYTSYYDFVVSSTTTDGAWPEYPTNNYSTTYESPYYASVSYPRVVIDGKGNVLATFIDSSSQNQPTSGGGAYYARKPAGDNNWQYPIKITGSGGTINSPPALATDGSGAMLVWPTTDASNVYKVVASRYTVAKQFVAPVEIGDPELQNSAYFAVDRSIVSDGKAFHTIWTQYVGSSRNAYVQHYDIATGKWDATPTPVSDGIARIDQRTSIGVDGHGNTLAAFEQFVGDYDTVIMSSRRKASDGKWSTAEPLTEEGHGFAEPVLAVAENGVAALLFRGGGRDGGPNVPYVGAQFLSFK